MVRFAIYPPTPLPCRSGGAVVERIIDGLPERVRQAEEMLAA
jgi:hypothetical protein